MTPARLEAAVRRALARRVDLVGALHAEGTDCYRLFHGASEGWPGVAVDRYGPVLLVQTWGVALSDAALDLVSSAVSGALGLGTDLALVWRERVHAPHTRVADPGAPAPRPTDPRLDAPIGRELGLAYDVRPVHAGQDPLLFLDLRAGRRRVRSHAADKSVLNLFAYTCGIGVCAAAGGASEVWNVDFAASALAVGRANAERNGVASETFRLVREDVIPVVRQLAGLPVKGRATRRRTYLHLAPRRFDIVVLDPPRWATGPFGAVDVVRDYPALFKPALLATHAGGHVLATNHVPGVPVDDWLAVLARTAEKVGRRVGAVEVIPPDADFPAFDGRPPLKMAWIEVAD